MTDISILSQRERLQVAERAVVAAIGDIDRAGNEAQMYACYAAVWAAVLMVADITKIGFSALDPRAKSMFAVIDKSIGWANKLLSFWGHTPITKKSDVLKQVDPQFKGAVHFVEDIRTAKNIFGKLKLNPPNSKELGLVVDLGLAMADDTLLIMDAMNTGNKAAGAVGAARRSAATNLEKIRSQLRQINSVISGRLDLEEHRARTGRMVA